MDRIVGIGAFEHFGHERYDGLFTLAHALLPDDGIMLLHSITGLHPTEIVERGMPISFTFARFIKFIATEIFPGERCIKYLTGCAQMFRIGYIDVNQFTLRK